MKNEARVGVVVVIALTLMVTGYFYLRGLGLASDKYYMRLIGATNITPGNEVRLQGVKIGQVLDVELNDEQKPILTIALKRTKSPIQLLKSYKYTVQSSALIGENYVDITGPFRGAAPAYEPNNPEVIIPVRASSPLTNVTENATELINDMGVTLSKLNVTLDRINKGVLSYDNQTKLARALEGVAKLTERAGQSVGPNGVKIGFGDPRAQQGLNDTLQNAASAAREINVAAGDLRLMARDLRGVVGSNKGQVNALMANLNKTASEVGGLAESLSFLVKNGGLRENLNATLTNARVATENIAVLTANLKDATGENGQSDLKATLTAARRAAENIEATTKAFKDFTNEDTQKNLREGIKALTETAAALKETAQSIKTTVGDPETQKQLKGTLTSINQASATLAETTANLKDASAGFKNVLGDPKVQDDLKALPGALRASADELQKTLATTRNTAQAFGDLAQGVGGLLPRKRRPAGETKPGETPSENTKASAKLGGEFPTGTSLTYRNLSNFSGAPRVGRDVAGNSYGDLQFDANLFGGPLRLGVSNVGEGTDVTAQTGRYFGNSVALRYGIYRSQLGAGVEFRKGRFFAEGNAWNLNNGSYNAIAGVRVTPQVEVFAGRESIRGVRANSVGVRLRP